jgi:shikimate dehydrogenase
MMQTWHFGLLGHRISYTLSPRIFAILADLLHREIKFSTLDVTPEQMLTGVESARAFDGFSVTIPYKEQVVPLMNQLSDVAKLVGAVNSVKVEGGRFLGYNTDGDGFLYPLRQEKQQFQRALVFGHGGSARAVLWAMMHRFPKLDMTVCGRSETGVEATVATLRKNARFKGGIESTTYDHITIDDEYDLIVNCTPLGGDVYPGQSPLPEGFQFSGCPVCYDLNYRPQHSLLGKAAEDAGCRVITGLPMLASQAVSSYAVWTGETVDADDLCEKVLAALAE